MKYYKMLGLLIVCAAAVAIAVYSYTWISCPKNVFDEMYTALTWKNTMKRNQISDASTAD